MISQSPAMFRSNMLMMMMIVATVDAVAMLDTTDQDQLFNVGQSSETTTTANEESNNNNNNNIPDEIGVDVPSMSTSSIVDGSLVNDSIVASCTMNSNRHIALLNQQNVEGHILLWQNINLTGPLKMSLRLKGFKVDCSSSSSSSSNTQNPSGNMTGCRSINDDDHNNSNVTVANVDDSGTFIKAFGMHIHEGADTTFGCQSVGNHYNPFNMTHGGPSDPVKHLGDLGNIYADHTGTVNMELSFDDLSLVGNHSILNRAIVIHSGPDDFGKSNNPASKITGNSGIRIACCIIETLQM